jgi:aminoglycoside phosphotransferase (APT) family kinase protein
MDVPCRGGALNLSQLGTPIKPMTRVHGKGFNRMYRLDTDRGSFAVKELNLDRDSTFRHDQVFRFEQAAFAAGIAMPEPILASRDTLVHSWVDGAKVPEGSVPTGFAFEIGEILARIHALNVERAHVSMDDSRPPRDWSELAERAAATGQPWADELASHVKTFLAIAHFVDTCERPGPVVLTHRDIHSWNLLARGGRPVVLDWELSGKLELACELGSTALSLSKGPGFDHIDPAVFRSVLDGYVAGGGKLPASGPGWFVFMIGGWLGFTHWNIVRCLAGIEAGSGPDLAQRHEEVRNGLHGLPDMFGRLPELQDLLIHR